MQQQLFQIHKKLTLYVQQQLIQIHKTSFHSFWLLLLANVVFYILHFLYRYFVICGLIVIGRHFVLNAIVLLPSAMIPLEFLIGTNKISFNSWHVKCVLRTNAAVCDACCSLYSSQYDPGTPAAQQQVLAGEAKLARPKCTLYVSSEHLALYET